MNSFWKQAMDEEIDALFLKGTWDLVTAPTGSDVVGCRWVFTMKYRPDRYKARLVAEGFIRLMELTTLRLSGCSAQHHLFLLSIVVNQK